MSCSIQCTNTSACTVRILDVCVYVMCVCVCSYVGVFLMDNVCLIATQSAATVHSGPGNRPVSRPNPNPNPNANPRASQGWCQGWCCCHLNVCKIASVFVVLPTYTCKSLILPCTSVSLSLSHCVLVCVRLSAYIHYTCMRIRRKYWGFT